MRARATGEEMDDGAVCRPSVLEAPLGEPEAADLARVLAALADPVRLRLLSLVAARGEVCSCDLEVPLGRSQPTISHHTKVLADCGLVVGERRGRWTWWRVEPARLRAVRRELGLWGPDEAVTARDPAAGRTASAGSR